MKINNCSACKESHDGIFIVTPPERIGPGFLCPKTNTWVTIISVAPSIERVGGQLDFVSVGFSTLDDDPINPQHYHRTSGHEVIDVLLAWGLGFTLGNAVKYIARHALKGDPVARLQYERDEWERKATHSVSVELHGKTVDEAKATLNAQLAEARHEVEAARKLVSETKMGSVERVLRRRLAKVIEAVDACKGDFKSLPVVKEIRAFAAGERDA